VLGTHLVSGSEDRRVKVRVTGAGASWPRERALVVHVRFVYALAIWQGKTLSCDDCVRMWDMGVGRGGPGGAGGVGYCSPGAEGPGAGGGEGGMGQQPPAPCTQSGPIPPCPADPPSLALLPLAPPHSCSISPPSCCCKEQLMQRVLTAS
jgi:hypothetical protein